MVDGDASIETRRKKTRTYDPLDFLLRNGDRLLSNRNNQFQAGRSFPNRWKSTMLDIRKMRLKHHALLRIMAKHIGFFETLE